MYIVQLENNFSQILQPPVPVFNIGKIGLNDDFVFLLTTYREDWGTWQHFFASVFTHKCSSHSTKLSKFKGRNWQNEEPTVGKDQVWGHLRSLKVDKSVGSNEVHPRVLREPADEAAKPLLVIAKICGSPFSSDWKKKLEA